MPITCKLCNKEFERITPTHLHYKHNGMTMIEYRRMFPAAPTLSNEAKYRIDPKPIKYTITCPNCGVTKTLEKKSLCAYERKFCCHSCANSYNSSKNWASPEYRAKMLKTFQSPEHSAKLSKLGIEKWEDLEYRNKYEGERDIKYTIECPNCGKTRTFVKDHPCSYENKFCDRACAVKFRWNDPEQYEQICKNMKQACNTPEARQKNSDTTREQWEDPEIRARRLAGMRKTMQTEDYKRNLAEAMDKTRQTEAYQQAWAEGMKMRPNKPESTLFELLSEHDYKYTYKGDGSLWLGTKNPDFIWQEENKIIEMFGSYWHDESEIETRTEHFAEYGYDTLIVWDYELDDTETLLTKLEKFHQD